MSSKQIAAHVSLQLRLLGRFLKRDTCFLEIGAGDCALSLLSPIVETAFAALSPAARTRLSRNKLVRGLLELRLVAWK